MADKKEYVKLWVSYESYFEAFSDVEVGRLVRAMIQYRASREEPKFNGNERFIWPAIRRDIDESLEAQEATAVANRENGKKGGRPPKPSKPNGFTENPKNPFGFSESEKSHGQGQGQGQGQGKGQGQGQNSAPAREEPPPPSREAIAEQVIADYLSRVNPMASPASLDELRGYVRDMGPDCCRRAIDIALDERKVTWSYVRGILRSKLAQGVRCLADWDRLEAGRQKQGPKGSSMPDYSHSEEESL